MWVALSGGVFLADEGLCRLAWMVQEIRVLAGSETLWSDNLLLVASVVCYLVEALGMTLLGRRCDGLKWNLTCL